MNFGKENINTPFTDTGLWKLVISVSMTGMSAVIRNVEEPGADPMVIFHKEWEATEADLLQKVEEAIYSHPRLLDDFATEIVIFTPKSLWIPSDFTDEGEDFDPELFTSVYPASSQDIFADYGAVETCLYAIAPELHSFFLRTLPGCRIVSHISVIKNFFEHKENSGKHGESIYVNLRENEMDLFAFRHGKFLSGSTHIWQNSYDVAYKVVLLSKCYGLNPESTTIHLYGSAETARGVEDFLLEFYPTIIPENTANEDNLPFAVTLSIRK